LGKYHTDRNNLIWSKLEEGVATEGEILARKHEQELQRLAEFEAQRGKGEAGAGELRRKIAERQALDTIKLQTQQYSSLAGIVDTAMGHISQIVGQEGGAAFEIMKAISRATATVKGAEAIVSAWAAGNATGIPGAGAAAAIVTGTGVAARIATIARTQPGGGGGAAPVSAGAAAAPAAAAPAAAGSQQTMVVKGLTGSGIMSMLSARDLAKVLLDFQRDGGRVILEG
jgi:hypothetical protein